MNRRLENIAEEDLLAAVRPRAWERALEKLGWLLGAGLAVLALAYGAWWLFSQTGFTVGSMALALFALIPASIMSILGVVLIGSLFVILAELRATPFRAELSRRRGQAPLAAYEAEAREGLQRTGGPDCVVLFRGAALPHGGLRWIRIEIQAEPFSGRLQARWGPAGDVADPEKQNRFGTAAGELAPGACRELLAGLDAVGGAGKPRVAPVHDGFPCELLTLRRDSPARLTVSINLAGVRAAEEAHPAVKLLRLVLDLEAKATGSPRYLMGAADFSGNIMVGPT